MELFLLLMSSSKSMLLFRLSEKRLSLRYPFTPRSMFWTLSKESNLFRCCCCSKNHSFIWNSGNTLLSLRELSFSLMNWDMFWLFSKFSRFFSLKLIKRKLKKNWIKEMCGCKIIYLDQFIISSLAGASWPWRRACRSSASCSSASRFSFEWPAKFCPCSVSNTRFSWSGSPISKCSCQTSGPFFCFSYRFDSFRANWSWCGRRLILSRFCGSYSSGCDWCGFSTWPLNQIYILFKQHSREEFQKNN